MPIPFTCAHCGHYTLVSDDFAGKTGPCSACNHDVTVPLIVRPNRSPNSIWVIAPVLACIILALVMLVAVVAIVSFPQLGSPTMATTTISYNDTAFKTIGLAIHNYHSEHGTLPPAYLENENGDRKTSWRALVLPYMPQTSLAAAYDFDQDWDSDANASVRNSIISGFRAITPNNSSNLETNFVLITGPGTAFEGATAKPFAQLLNGTSNIVLAVQVQSLGIEWTEPEDIHINQLPNLLKSGVLTDERGMVRFMKADGAIGQMSVPQAIATLPNMAMIGSRLPPSAAATPSAPASRKPIKPRRDDLLENAAEDQE